MHLETDFEIGPEHFPFYFYNQMVDVEIISKNPHQCVALTRGEDGLLTFPPKRATKTTQTTKLHLIFAQYVKIQGQPATHPTQTTKLHLIFKQYVEIEGQP